MPKFQSGNTLHQTLDRGPDGRFISRGRKPKRTTRSGGSKRRKTRYKKELDTTEVVLVVDRSYSMLDYKTEAEGIVREQIAQLKSDQHEGKINARVSIIEFDYAINHVATDLHPEAVWYDLRPRGSTALRDAVKEGIEKANSLHGEAKLIIVISDGMDNVSKTSISQLRGIIKNFQAQDDATLVLLAPHGYKNELSRNLGLHHGNVTEWEQTRSGAKAVTQVATKALANYSEIRSQGETKTSYYFVDVDPNIEQKITPLKGVRKWQVAQETPISDFIISKVGNYPLGSVYYELMKSEKVQPHKDFLIRNRKTGKFYDGRNAETLLGLPTPRTGDIRVKPGNHGEFQVFIKSTSFNRKLVRGSTVALKGN